MEIKNICILRAGDVTFISRIHRAALALQECNHYNVTLISILPRKVAEVKDYPYVVITLPIKTRILKSNFFLLVRIVEGLIRMYNAGRKQKADIYVAIAVEDLIIAYLLTRFSSAKLVYNANELEADRKLYKSKFVQSVANKFIKKIEKRILCKADCVIAADFERGKVMEKWYDLEKVEIIRNLPLYHLHLGVNYIREKLAINSEMKILLYQGILGLGRGLESSILASSKVNNKQFILVLLGNIDNAYKNTLIKIANETGFKRLHFISAVPWQDLLYWTSSADISLVLIQNVSLSYYLAAPNKLYESIMAEVPYIASNFPEINHVHDIADAGILVNPENSNEIANAIERLLTDDDFIQGCKNKAKKAKEIFNWDKEKIRLISLFDHL
jgi:glycosyltransferase involved in cell wall biosynthesis